MCASFNKVLKLDELPREFTNFKNHDALNGTMTKHLLDFCRLLSPEILEGKCIFQVSDLRGSNNEFVELSAAKTTVVATSSVMMSGRNIQVAKIMLYEPIWRQKYYDQPMRELSRSSSCILL